MIHKEFVLTRLRSLWVFLFVFICAVIPVTSHAQKKAVPSEAATAPLEQKVPVAPQITVGTLDNGVRYYIRENRRPEKRAELRLVVKTGSVLEDEDQRGLAHFVEHMSFNGTKNFRKQEIVEFMESIGMSFGPGLNAYTSFDETVYMLQIPTDQPGVMETAFQILEDWAHNVLFEDEEIDKERGVIIEEWRLGQGAGARMRDKQFPILFKGSKYAERLPIGTLESLENFEYESLKRFYRDWYRPDLMAVIAVGDFDDSDVEALVTQHFGAIMPAENPRSRIIVEVPDHDETLCAIATDKENPGTSVAVYYKQSIRDQSTIGAYRRNIVEGFFNGMLNFRFDELIQKADPPFLGASSGQQIFVKSKEVYYLSAAVEESGIERGLETLLVEAERVAQYGFTPSELDRFKKLILRSVEQAYTERDKSNSITFAEEFIRAFLEDEPIPGIEYEFELYKRFVPEITLYEINSLAWEWITDRNRVIMVNAPEKAGLRTPGEEELLAVFEKARDIGITPYMDTVTDQPLIERMPVPGTITAERTIAAVGITEWDLSNGVKVVVKPTDFKEDQILIEAFSPGGTSLTTDEDFIAHSMAAQVIAAGGLGNFNAIDLQKFLSDKVASVSPVIGGLEEGLSGGASPKDLETLFQLIYLRFTAPRADPEIFASLQSRFRAVLANRSASPTAVFSDTLQAVLTQHHYRARPLTVERLDEMALQKSHEFYVDRFADASDFTFMFVGNIDIDIMKPLVTQYLGGLPSIYREETWRDIGLTPPEGVIKKIVRKGIEPQSQTAIIFTGVFEYNRTNNFALRATTSALQIKLREILREDLGGTYSVGVNYGSTLIPRQEYSVQISFGSDPERIDELTGAIFREIENLKQSGIEEEYITKVLEAQKRNRETNLKQNGYWLSQMGFRYRQGTDPSDILTYEEVYGLLDSGFLQAAAVRYFDMNNYVLVSLMPENRN
ncbi:M16 family metallopeptidase [candidate division KSB1 bacterium]